MPRKNQADSLAVLLTLPDVHLKAGKPYVRVSYQDALGKWKSVERRVRTPEEAIKKAAAMRKQLGLSGPGAFAGERMTFAELLDEYKRAHPNRPKWYTQPLADFFGARRIRAITFAQCQDFKRAREAVGKRRQRDSAPVEMRKPATINREMEALRAVLLFAVDQGWLERNPMRAGKTVEPLIDRSLEEPREVVPTPDEERRLLAQCVPPHRAHVRPLIIATRDTGLRKSALQSLTWRNVDFAQRLLWIPRGNRYKRRPKAIGMTARLYDELRALWEASDKNLDGKIFGKVKDFGKAYETACAKAGISGITFNDWRHGFATDLMEAGVPEHLAMKVAGHTRADTHAIYTNVDERLALQVAAALDKLHQAREQNQPGFIPQELASKQVQ
jgi:integrase